MIHLKPFEIADFDLFKTWSSSQEELSQFGGPRFSYPVTNEQLLEYINDPYVHAYKVIENENDITIGHGEIYIAEDYVPKLCRIIIGNKSYRGKGLGIGIVNQLLKLAFELSDSETAELNVYDWNISAYKCYRKCGFIVNPDKQKSVIVNGKNWISLNMVISRKNFNSPDKTF